MTVEGLNVKDMLYVAGQGSTVAEGPKFVGKLGSDLSVEEGQEATRLCALNALSTIHKYLGDLIRTAIGTNELPGNIAAEIEFIFEVEE